MKLKQRLRVAAVIVSLVSIVGMFPILVLHGMHRSRFVSCRNHAAHLSMAVADTVDRRGWLPYEKDALPERVLRSIPTSVPWGLNCNEAAPDQGVGGWQYLNASSATWGEILKGFRGERVPVVWCGRAHAPDWPGSHDMRESIQLPVDQRCEAIYLRFIDTGDFPREPGKQPRFHSMLFPEDIPDAELRAKLARINEILRRRGEPEITLDIQTAP